MVEHLPAVFLREAFPVFLSGLQQRESSHHVGARESERALYRPIHMALGGEVYYPVDLVFPDYAPHLFEVSDVGAHESIVRFLLDVLEVGKVAGVCELVEVDNSVIGIFVYEEAYHIFPIKPAPPVINILRFILILD